MKQVTHMDMGMDTTHILTHHPFRITARVQPFLNIPPFPNISLLQ